MIYLIALVSVVVVGWIAASVLGTQAYFRGEQSKPIHERNWRSDNFEQLAASITGQNTDFGDRIPAFVVDSYASSNLPS
jgi:hypothetical protein